MKTSTTGIDFIKEKEGFRTEMYYDQAGLPTIGYGTLIDTPQEQKYLTRPITEIEATGLLKSQLTHYENAVNDSISVPLKQNQFDALVSLAYNIGGTAFSKSTVVKKINSHKNETDISTWWKKWRMAGGKVSPGLEKRREEEVYLFFSKKKAVTNNSSNRCVNCVSHHILLEIKQKLDNYGN